MKLPTLVVATVACLSGLAIADHSRSPCDSTVTTVDGGGATFYLVTTTPSPWVEVWVYQETNGHPGLQRGGTDSFSATGQFDPCWDVETATNEWISDPDSFVL